MKKLTCVLTCALLLISLLAGCASGDTASPIAVISREDGSGTRGAFIELFGVEQKNDAGEKVDYTTDKAEITSSTAVMITTVQGNKNAIGYISLGSYDSTQVKAVSVNDVECTEENIVAGTYTIARPFVLVEGPATDDLARAFLDYILSADGQAVVSEQGYIPVA